MLILAIDTSTSVCSLALYNGKQILASFTINSGLSHSEKMMPLLLGLLQSSDVDKKDIEGVAVSIGPGSFTGLRIGLAAAKTLAYAFKIPIVGVLTHEVLAYNVPLEDIYLSPLIDAQKGRVYQVIYCWRGNTLQVVETIKIREYKEAIDELSRLEKHCLILGDWDEKYDSLLANNVCLAAKNILKPNASSLALASYGRFVNGDVEDVFSIQPYYLKKSEAEILWEQRCKKNI